MTSIVGGIRRDINIINMFNSVSREQIFRIIKTRYPELLPFVKLLYKDEGTVFFRLADGLWESCSMEGGVNQGCPLSSTLAALILNEILKPLQRSLNERA